MKTLLLWLRRDFRLKDNIALSEATKNADQVIPFFIWAPEEEEPWPPGSASKWWLHHSLEQLAESLEKKESYLIIKEGNSLEQINSLIKETKASGVYWNRLYEPNIIKRDKEIKTSLKDSGFEVKSFPGAMLKEPWDVKNTSGKPFQVFTPFWKRLKLEYSHSKPCSDPNKITSPKKPKTIKLKELNLLPKIDWDKEFYSKWSPGEKGAKNLLDSFLKSKVLDYKELRDRTDLDASSCLSPHLHFGEISAKQIWNEVVKKEEQNKLTFEEAEPFLRQLAWREFSHQLLFNFPKTDLKPLRDEFKKFPWKKNKKNLILWQKGKTGYPLVDAGMKELWTTGIMHNRVRMVTASLLVKHLLIPWQEGAKWFWDTLLDADLANNTMGWQWTAGCGADASPYFRVFNPIIQGEKFDPEGEYIKKWLPELKDLPKKWIHKPFEAPSEVLEELNFKLGRDYPKPIIEHSEGRDQALDAYNLFKERKNER